MELDREGSPENSFSISVEERMVLSIQAIQGNASALRYWVKMDREASDNRSRRLCVLQGRYAEQLCLPATAMGTNEYGKGSTEVI